MHGTFNSLPCRELRWDQHEDGLEVSTSVHAIVDDSDALNRFVRCERTITTTTGLATGFGRVSVTDVVSNLGDQPVLSPMLYHLNFGAPLWSPGAKLVIQSADVVPRDEDSALHVEQWHVAPQAAPAVPERVYEHLDPVPKATLEGSGLRLSVEWDAQTMPRLRQWVHPRSGVYALGLEPANCGLAGREAEEATASSAWLAPGESRRTSVRLTAERLPT